MATSSLSSLGLGSSGALSYDTIDKLRAADESAIITPIDKKITANKTKASDLPILTTMSATLKASTSALSDEISYLKRTTTVSNTAVSVTAASGSAIQDFTLRVDELAQRDIYQTKGFTSESTALGLTPGKLTITIGGTGYDIDVTAGTTLTQLKDSINDIAGTKVTASVLNVGGTDPQRLIIKSDETGLNEKITFSATDPSILTGLELDSTKIGTAGSGNYLQGAQNATFLYNGVSISRAKNTVDDLVVGLSITLNEKQTTGNTNVSITQDVSDIKTNLESLVSSYNELISNLNETTKYDSTTKTAGTFQGVSQINSLGSSIRKQLLTIDTNGRSLIDYGIALNENGLLEFDATIFDNKMTSSALDVEKFFRGTTVNEVTTNGIFTDFNNVLADYVTGDNSILGLYNKSLSTEKNTLTKDRAASVSRLDDRYSIMATRFAAYDSIISKLNNQFSSLSMMIQQSYSSNN